MNSPGFVASYGLLGSWVCTSGSCTYTLYVANSGLTKGDPFPGLAAAAALYVLGFICAGATSAVLVARIFGIPAVLRFRVVPMAAAVFVITVIGCIVGNSKVRGRTARHGMHACCDAHVLRQTPRMRTSARPRPHGAPRHAASDAHVSDDVPNRRHVP